jgi:hypothetical protein
MIEDTKHTTAERGLVEAAENAKANAGAKFFTDTYPTTKSPIPFRIDETKSPKLLHSVGGGIEGGVAGLSAGIGTKMAGADVALSRCALRGAGAAAALTLLDYGIDRVLTNSHSNTAWYSLSPTERQPYASTIFKPNGIDAMVTGLSFGLPIDNRMRFGMVAGGWIAGRVANAVEHLYAEKRVQV